MESKDVHYADIISNDKGDILQVDRIGPDGEIFYIAILFWDGQGLKITGRRSLSYGHISQFHPASEDQKKLFLKCVNNR